MNWSGYVCLDTENKGSNIYGRRTAKGKRQHVRAQYIVHKDGNPIAAFKDGDEAVAYCEWRNGAPTQEQGV